MSSRRHQSPSYTPWSRFRRESGPETEIRRSVSGRSSSFRSYYAPHNDNVNTNKDIESIADERGKRVDRESREGQSDSRDQNEYTDSERIRRTDFESDYSYDDESTNFRELEIDKLLKEYLRGSLGKRHQSLKLGQIPREQFSTPSTQSSSYSRDSDYIYRHPNHKLRRADEDFPFEVMESHEPARITASASPSKIREDGVGEEHYSPSSIDDGIVEGRQHHQEFDEPMPKGRGWSYCVLTQNKEYTRTFLALHFDSTINLVDPRQFTDLCPPYQRRDSRTPPEFIREFNEKICVSVNSPRNLVLIFRIIAQASQYTVDFVDTIEQHLDLCREDDKSPDLQYIYKQFLTEYWRQEDQQRVEREFAQSKYDERDEMGAFVWKWCRKLEDLYLISTVGNVAERVLAKLPRRMREYVSSQLGDQRVLTRSELITLTRDHVRREEYRKERVRSVGERRCTRSLLTSESIGEGDADCTNASPSRLDRTDTNMLRTQSRVSAKTCSSSAKKMADGHCSTSLIPSYVVVDDESTNNVTLNEPRVAEKETNAVTREDFGREKHPMNDFQTAGEFIWHGFVCMGDSVLINLLSEPYDHKYLARRMTPAEIISLLKLAPTERVKYEKVLIGVGIDEMMNDENYSYNLQAYCGRMRNLVKTLVKKFDTKVIVIVKLVFPLHLDDRCFERVVEINRFIDKLAHVPPHPLRVLIKSFSLKHVFHPNGDKIFTRPADVEFFVNKYNGEFEDGAGYEWSLTARLQSAGRLSSFIDKLGDASTGNLSRQMNPIAVSLCDRVRRRRRLRKNGAKKEPSKGKKAAVSKIAASKTTDADHEKQKQPKKKSEDAEVKLPVENVTTFVEKDPPDDKADKKMLFLWECVENNYVQKYDISIYESDRLINSYTEIGSNKDTVLGRVIVYSAAQAVGNAFEYANFAVFFKEKSCYNCTGKVDWSRRKVPPEEMNSVNMEIIAILEALRVTEKHKMTKVELRFNYEWFYTYLTALRPEWKEYGITSKVDVYMPLIIQFEEIASFLPSIKFSYIKEAAYEGGISAANRMIRDSNVSSFPHFSNLPPVEEKICWDD